MGKNSYILKSAALLPIPLLVAAPFYGVGLSVATLVYLSIFTYFADEILVANRNSGQPLGRSANIYAEIVPIILAIAHLFLLPMAILFIAKGPPDLLGKLLTFMAFSLYFGTVSTANAHELIHRRERWRHSLGKWVFISILFGHHFSAHLAIHHPYVATNKDPNSASEGEGFYRFFLRAWIGSFRAGLTAEIARRKEKGLTAILLTPYTIYIAGAAVFMMWALRFGGLRALGIYLAFAFFAQAQLLLADYVQHYGLKRKERLDGRFEPVSIHHSWNAPHAFSSALILNASRHSDHHAHPSLPYSDLRNRASDGAPMLPYSVLVMSIIALFPNRWRALMAQHVLEWEQQHSATDVPFDSKITYRKLPKRVA